METNKKTQNLRKINTQMCSVTLSTDQTKMRVHESWQSRDPWLAVLNAFPTLSCILFKCTFQPFE